MIKSIFTSVIVLLGTIGCSSRTIEIERFYANRIDKNNVQKQEIADAVSKFMAGSSVTLADNVFIKQHTMTIERQPSVDSRGLVVEGRQRNLIRSFTLLKVANTCYLRDNASNTEIALPSVECTALDIVD